MSVAVTLPQRDGEALTGRLERLDGEVLHAVFPRAFAPGAPVQMELSLEVAQRALTAKTVGSRRRDDGDFDVRLRPIDLRRETREALAAALA